MGEYLTMQIKHMVKCDNGTIDIKIKKNGQFHFCSLASKAVLGSNGEILRKGQYDFNSFLSDLEPQEKETIFEKAKEKYEDVKIIEDNS